MAWKKGQSGNPGGRGTEKAFADAIRAAVNVEDPKTRRRKLLAIADTVADAAISGESWAVNIVADRLDGKPAQAMEHSGPDGGAIEFDTTDTRAIARAVLALFREANQDSTP